MGSLFDYLDWRGDVAFADLGLNEVDNLIFSLISYIDFEGIVPREPSATPVTLSEAARGYLRLHRGEVPYLGKILPPETVTLMAKASKTRRFGGCRLTGYVNQVDEETQTQFSALTYLPNNGLSYLAFRGTDDTLVGWKENFNMSFMQPVPAQERAVEYVREIAPYLPGGFYVGGHSKGGNLAVYAAVKMEQSLQKRLICAFNNDGPGFDRAFVCGADYLDIRERIRTLVPHSSVVGMLLEHEEDYEVVKSNATGLLQHNGFSWEVLGGAFIHLDTVTEESKHLDSALKEWMNTLSAQERADFVDTFYETLTSTNAKNLTELSAEKIKLVKAWGNLDAKAKSIILKCISLLLKPNGNMIRKKTQHDRKQSGENNSMGEGN